MNLTPRMNHFPRFLVPAFALLSAAALHAAPDNDRLADASELFVGPAVTASNAAATLDADEALPPGFTSSTYQGSLWWHWKPVFSGWYEITTAGSGIDTVLSVWTSSSGTLTLVHVNAESIQFQAASDTEYKIAVAGHGTTGSLSLRAFYIPDPFAKVVASSFEQTAVDVTNGTAGSKATLTIEASRELAEGTFSVIDPTGLEVASVPFSAANRVSGNVAHGEYEVSFSLPQYIVGGGYKWNVSVTNSALGKVASIGSGALSPLGAASDDTLAVVNNGVVDAYAQWVAANGGGSLASLVGGSESFGGELGLDTFAFGLNGDQSLVPTGGPDITTESAADGAKRLRVKFARRLHSAQNGLNYQVQFSDDLIDWEDASNPAQTLASDGTFESVEVEDTVSVTDAPRRFARVLVERSVP